MPALKKSMEGGGGGGSDTLFSSAKKELICHRQGRGINIHY